MSDLTIEKLQDMLKSGCVFRHESEQACRQLIVTMQREEKLKAEVELCTQQVIDARIMATQYCIEKGELREALRKCLPLVTKTKRVYVDKPSGGMHTIRLPHPLYVEIQQALSTENSDV